MSIYPNLKEIADFIFHLKDARDRYASQIHNVHPEYIKMSKFVDVLYDKMFQIEEPKVNDWQDIKSPEGALANEKRGRGRPKGSGLGVKRGRYG